MLELGSLYVCHLAIEELPPFGKKLTKCFVLLALYVTSGANGVRHFCGKQCTSLLETIMPSGLGKINRTVLLF